MQLTQTKPIVQVLADRKIGRPRGEHPLTQQIIMASAEGLATLLPKGAVTNVFNHAKRQGLKVKQSKCGAPEGQVYVWVGGTR